MAVRPSDRLCISSCSEKRHENPDFNKIEFITCLASKQTTVKSIIPAGIRLTAEFFFISTSSLPNRMKLKIVETF
jgi:hypothetical protein